MLADQKQLDEQQYDFSNWEVAPEENVEDAYREHIRSLTLIEQRFRLEGTFLGISTQKEIKPWFSDFKEAPCHGEIAYHMDCKSAVLSESDLQKIRDAWNSSYALCTPNRSNLITSAP